MQNLAADRCRDDEPAEIGSEPGDLLLCLGHLGAGDLQIRTPCASIQEPELGLGFRAFDFTAQPEAEGKMGVRIYAGNTVSAVMRLPPRL